MATFADSSGVFIGRRDQLAGLIARRKAAGRGQGSVALVCGDAGIGKTRLLEEFAATLTHGRGVVHWVRFDEFGAQGDAPFERVLEEGARRSTALLVEDAQWAPLQVLQQLTALCRGLHLTRMLVVVTYRAADVSIDAERTVLLAKLARLPDAGLIDLPPLDRNETRAMVRALLTERDSLGSRAVEGVQRRSGGNPLILRELLLNARGASDLPLSIQGLVAEWLRPFPERQRNVLAHAALMREGFTATDIGALLAAPQEEIAATLRLARALRLIEERRGVAATYLFRHPVVAEALERGFLAHEARALHVRVAHAIEASGNVVNRAAELAEHWREAGNNEMAATYAEKAGDRAFDSADYSEAARWYESAVGSMRRGGSVTHHLYEKLGSALARAGNPVGSHLALRTAASNLEAAGDVARAMEVRLHDALLAQQQADITVGLSRLESATRSGVPAASHRYAQAVAAYMLLFRQEIDRALEMVADFPFDDPATDRAALHKYWDVIAYAAALRSDPTTFYSASDKAGDLARRSGDPAVLAEAEQDFAILAMHFPSASAGESFERAIVMAQEHGLPWIEAYTRAYAAIDDYVRGRLSAARSHLRALQAVAAETPLSIVVPLFAGLVVGRALCDDELIRECARPERLEATFGTGMATYFGRVAGPYAQWLIDEGRRDEARALLHRCVVALPSAYATFLTMPVVASYADAEDVADARRLLAAAARNEEDLIANATLPLFDALVERRDGRPGASRAVATIAAERYRSIGWTGMEAWARDLAGERVVALNLYRSCSNVRELRRLESEGDGRERGRAPDASSVLSPRERSIVALVAAGKSNRVIATTLSVSEKTVERHLTSVFEKLGFRSRTELAASTLAHALTRQ
jgi:DNA-binding CsgD family transcriptional regulator